MKECLWHGEGKKVNLPSQVMMTKKIKNKKGTCAMHSIQSIFVRVGTLQM